MTAEQQEQQEQQQELELLTPPPSAAPASGRAGLPAATLVYSADGRYVFQRQAHVVRVLHAKSGRVLHECARGANRSVVRALAIHPHNALQLLAAYEDGYIVVWDFVEQKPLVELDAKAPVLWMASSRTSPSQLLLVVQTEASGWSLVEFSLKKKKRGRVLFQNSKLAFQTAALQSYTSPQGEGDQAVQVGDFLVLVAGSKMVTVWLHHQPGAKDSSNRVYVMQKINHPRDVTCVAVSPTQREFSIGDELGQIYRFHEQVPAGETAAKMHWHSHAVHCIQYSSDGQFLLSGGEECVLVSWQLESGRRAYLPRLPASVEVIAPRQDGGVYAVGLADSVLFQYNPVTREQEWEARGLARAGNSAANSLPTRQLVVDPLSKSLVLNGSSGAGVLQFYEPFADRVLQTLLLSERNQVTRTEDEVLPTLQASHSSFSARGGDLVTLHAPTTAKHGDEQALRFWTRRVDGSFFVNTAVDAPHGRARVTNMTFSPSQSGDCVVTADEQGDFKVWQKTVMEAGGSSWHCQSVVRFRDEPVTAVGFARDGSLLAVAYGNKLTLWDVATHSLRRVIPSADGQKINQIVFPGINSPFVVVVTESQVQVWSLLSLSLWWRYTVPKGAIVAEEALYERFMVWMPVDESKKKTLVLVFEAQTPVPTCVRVVDLGSKVWSAGFHPGTGDIVLLDNKTGVWRLDGPNARSLDARRRKQAHVAAVAARDAAKDGEQEAKALSAIYNAASGGRLSEKKANQNKHAGPNGVTVNDSATSSLFDAPAHVLPSMTALYRSFMDTMLPKPHQVVEADESPKNANGDASTSQKKKNKRRKKQQQQQQQTSADPAADENGEQRKRMKLQVEKELANPELQQQTYSKLLETFRNSKARRA
ncbi:WD repeat-containing protein 75 [Phytophthora pseudosyringae]|uniref:WD repeat-containing protein 75 n=1 Tax=Phytophthora pseudosyringae TaxID=221518 RepID=A0A8T1W3C3_9STRA|nr:WD repeat-containing protein 75 [Phytophthora pseudosyringae]